MLFVADSQRPCIGCLVRNFRDAGRFAISAPRELDSDLPYGLSIYVRNIVKRRLKNG
jgi:hypothetical protein